MLAQLFKKRQTGPMDWSRPPAGTSIRYRLSTASPVVLKIYDSAGQEIRELVNGPQKRGDHEVCWDGRTHQGRLAASGIYYYRLFMNHSAVTGRIVMSGSPLNR